MAKSPTIKNDPFKDAPDPLDLVIPLQPSKIEVARREPQTKEQGRGDAHGANTDEVKAKPNHKKEKMTVHLTHDLIERVKNAAYWNPKLTIAGIAERGVALIIEEIERENGGAYPQRDQELKGGRPIGG